MAKFRYNAYGQAGQFAEGVIEATSEEAATDQLWAQGLTAFKLSADNRVSQTWWQRDLFSKSQLSQADLTIFVRELATLASADMPLDETLRILSDGASSGKSDPIAADLLQEVLAGSMLSDAMAKQPSTFSAECINIVRAGEIGGRLGEVLVELADLLERRLGITKRIRSALIYPIILILLSMGTLAIIVSVLVPSIASIFLESGKPPPTMIRLILILLDHWIFVASGVSAFLITSSICIVLALKSPNTRLMLDRRILSLPLLGSFLLQQISARFARTLGTLMKSGVPMLQALTSARSTISNRYFGAGLGRAIDAVREGAKLHNALESNAHLTTVALRMISVGEESGRLEQMLMRAAEMLEEQSERRIERFMTILTPLLTVVIALLVGGVIMATMSAVMSINELALR